MTDHRPFDDRPFRLRMGLRPLHPDAWLERDERAAEELALKERLVAERYDDVVAVVDRPAVHAACEELWSEVRRATGAGARAGLHPVVSSGLATQEDWAVMVPVDGRTVLAAACVCFPTRWVLATKIGRPMGEVHQHVAFYADQLERPVDTFFDRLTVDRPVWRLNWNLMDDPSLFQPVHVPPDPPIAPDEIGDRFWLRVERQTLRRLPATGAVVFGIRVHQRPLVEVAADPGELAALGRAVGALPPDTLAYKGLTDVADDLLEWIARRAAGPGQGS